MTDAESGHPGRHDVRSVPAGTDPYKQFSHQPRVLAVAGGGPAIGKTSMVLNLALALASGGERVLLLDGSDGKASVSTMLGQTPAFSLAQVLDGSCAAGAAVTEGPFGLQLLVSHPADELQPVNKPLDGEALWQVLAGLEGSYDYIVIDVPGGRQPPALDLICAAAMACLVVTPDPGSLAGAFRLLKALRQRGYQGIPGVLVNMAQGAGQAQSVFRRFAGATQRCLGLQPDYLGAIWRDETLAQAVLSQQPVALMPATDPSCHQFHTVAETLRMRFGQDTTPVPARPCAAIPDGRPETTPDTMDAGEECNRLLDRLGSLLGDPGLTAVRRYEALCRMSALLESVRAPRTPEMPHPVMAESHATKLPATKLPATRPSDHFPLADQQSLVRALREQPADRPLNELLNVLMAGPGR